jgi:hypothetical protein
MVFGKEGSRNARHGCSDLKTSPTYLPDGGVIVRPCLASKLWNIVIIFMPLALGACVSYRPYPGAPVVANPAGNAALYQEFSISRDSSGEYHAQGKSILPDFYMAQVQPAWVVRDFKDAFRWRDFGWLAVLVGSLNWELNTHPDSGQWPADYGLSRLSRQAVIFGVVTDILGRRETRLENESMPWNRSLAKDLGQPEPLAWVPKTVRYDDTLSGWKVGLGYSSTHRSGQDYQDYFTPSLGILTFRYTDPWTEGLQLCVGYGFESSWTLELEAELVGTRSNGVVWSGSNITQRMDQYLYQSSIRLGRAWDWRMANQIDLSLMPFVGLGVGWMRGDGTETDSSENLLGSFVERSTAPASLAGIRVSISTAPHFSYTLETGYRWLHFDYLVVTEGQGTFARRSSPDTTLRGAQASWDCGGPFIKIGLMFL